MKNLTKLYHNLTSTAKSLLSGPARIGSLFALGFVTTTLIAVAVSGTIKTWTATEVLKSADLNTTIASLQTAITSAAFTISGTNATYTGGNVGIGTTAPTRPLTVITGTTRHNTGGGVLFVSSLSGSTGGVLLGSDNNVGYIAGVDGLGTTVGILTLNQNGGNVGIATTSPTLPLSVNGDANKTGGTAWAVFSDIRLKDSIKPYLAGLKEVIQINPITYRYKKDNALELKGSDKEVGISAQELEKILPESVSKNSKDYLQFKMDYVSWAMLNSIKELKSLYDAEKSINAKKLSKLEEENTELASRYASLLDDQKKLESKLEKMMLVMERQSIETYAKK